jgi:putative colanic acid biosynthesis glycosyltransferase
MKVIAFNCTNIGGGAKVFYDLADELSSKVTEYITFTPTEIRYSKKLKIIKNNSKIHGINARIGQIFGLDYEFIPFNTFRLINLIKKEEPDVLHLHGIHNWSINYSKLFRFLAKSNIRIIWTQHDSWNYTGKCVHYLSISCNKWIAGCNKCPLLNEYPKSYFFDNSKKLYLRKKKVFNSLINLKIVSVSEWLAKDLRKSFLNRYPISIISNGIKQATFKKNVSKVNFPFEEDEFLILSVASQWTKNKGYDDILSFHEYSKHRSLNVKFMIIGVDDKQFIECKNLGIYALKRINSSAELEQWYNRTNVFFNPSIQETFGLVTIEAMLAGSPIIAYNLSSLPEILFDTKSFLIPRLSFTDFEKAINDIKKNGKEYYSKSVIEKVKKSYNLELQADKYFDLYNQ